MSLDRLKDTLSKVGGSYRYNPDYTKDVFKAFPRLYLELIKNLKDVKSEEFWYKIAKIASEEINDYKDRDLEELASELYTLKFSEEPDWFGQYQSERFEQHDKLMDMEDRLKKVKKRKP